jgi:hypothetical protein
MIDVAAFMLEHQAQGFRKVGRCHGFTFSVRSTKWSAAEQGRADAVEELLAVHEITSTIRAAGH